MLVCALYVGQRCCYTLTNIIPPEHFGPTYGTGDVSVMEIGNEPDYPIEMYSDILLGMARGIKHADPRMKVLPGVPFVNHKPIPYWEYITPEHMRWLDGLNGHYYSWASTERGRSGVHPESKVSIMRSLLQDLAVRDASAPDVPFYVTEWGWDSEGANEDCKFSECVSERSQALYAVRSALWFLRLGVERAQWFFYSNLDQEKRKLTSDLMTFTRSGLTGSSAVAFEEKMAFKALRRLVKTIGHLRIISVLREDPRGWAYGLGNDSRLTHIAVWRPINGDDTTELAVTISLPTLDLVPVKAWLLDGKDATTYVPLPEVSAISNWTITASAVPMVIELRTEGGQNRKLAGLDQSYFEESQQSESVQLLCEAIVVGYNCEALCKFAATKDRLTEVVSAYAGADITITCNDVNGNVDVLGYPGCRVTLNATTFQGNAITTRSKLSNLMTDAGAEEYLAEKIRVVLGDDVTLVVISEPMPPDRYGFENNLQSREVDMILPGRLGKEVKSQAHGYTPTTKRLHDIVLDKLGTAGTSASIEVKLILTHKFNLIWGPATRLEISLLQESLRRTICGHSTEENQMPSKLQCNVAISQVENDNTKSSFEVVSEGVFSSDGTPLENSLEPTSNDFLPSVLFGIDTSLYMKLPLLQTVSLRNVSKILRARIIVHGKICEYFDKRNISRLIADALHVNNSEVYSIGEATTTTKHELVASSTSTIYSGTTTAAVSRTPAETTLPSAARDNHIVAETTQPSSGDNRIAVASACRLLIAPLAVLVSTLTCLAIL